METVGFEPEIDQPGDTLEYGLEGIDLQPVACQVLDEAWLVSSKPGCRGDDEDIVDVEPAKPGRRVLIEDGVQYDLEDGGRWRRSDRQARRVFVEAPVGSKAREVSGS
jgi:hypothetical protein